LVINIGIIGYRNHAQRLIRLIDEHSECSLKQIYHPTKKLDDSRITNDFSQLSKCDAIIISSPNSTHFDYLKKLESFNGYILCEKPPAVSLDEVKKLEKFNESKKRKIFFNFNLRFSRLYEVLSKYTKSESLGDLVHIEIISSQGLAFKKEYVNSWRADGRKNKFNLLDTLSIHYLDLIHYVLGNSKNQIYFPNLISNNGTSYDTGHLILEYEKFNVSIINSYATPLINQISIIGTNGYISIKNNHLEILSPRDTFDEKNLFKTPPTILSETFNTQEDYNTSLKNSLNYFLSVILEKKEFPISLFDQSLKTNHQIINLRNT